MASPKKKPEVISDSSNSISPIIKSKKRVLVRKIKSPTKKSDYIEKWSKSQNKNVNTTKSCDPNKKAYDKCRDELFQPDNIMKPSTSYNSKTINNNSIYGITKLSPVSYLSNNKNNQILIDKEISLNKCNSVIKKVESNKNKSNSDIVSDSDTENIIKTYSKENYENMLKPSQSGSTIKKISDSLVINKSDSSSDSDDVLRTNIKLRRNRKCNRIESDTDEEIKKEKTKKTRRRLISPKKKAPKSPKKPTLNIKTKKKATSKDLPTNQNTIPDMFKKSPKKKQINDVKTKKSVAASRKSGSYEKYGIHLPSFDDILKSRACLNAYKDKIETACQFVDYTPQENVKLIANSPEKSKLLLGCDHLTLDEVGDYFKKHEQFCFDIINKKGFSARHDVYVSCNNSNTLTYNTSMIAFNSPQKQLLANLISRRFDNDIIFPNKEQYLFKVLLPELCLKIFMDVHNMTLDDAMNYLENRPCDDFL